MASKAIIVMGSIRDLEFSKEIGKHLLSLGVPHEFHVASAHKTPEKVLRILKQHEEEQVVYVTVAGRSNALSSFIDANTPKPVIACPVYSEKFGGADIFSSLRVPSGVGSVVTIEPEAAAIAVAKILAVADPKLSKRVCTYQRKKKEEIEKADQSIRQK